MPDILDEIVSARREDYARLGPTFGSCVPASRIRPIVPFLREPGAILEIKRASPSKGDIAPNLDPVDLAGRYAAAGARNVSVLTESRFFKGSLDDLVAVSSAYPDIAFLRKDFLLYEDEIEIAYRAGADAVLLIARILEKDALLRMAAKCRSFGMVPFIEVREESDVPKLEAASRAGAVLSGVNARDLATFHIDPLVPATMRSRLPCKAVFESGAATPGACRFARRLGFDGILIGEAAARNPERASTLVEGFLSARPDWSGHFWREIGKRARARDTDPARGAAQPLIKICGLANADDALLAADLGADLLGFVFADSPRRASASLVREVSSRLALRSRSNASESVGVFSAGHSGAARGARKQPLLVGVVTDPESAAGKEAIALTLEGTLDAIQYHGDGAEGLRALDGAGGTYGLGRYAAVRLGGDEDLSGIDAFLANGEPRVLVDARVEGFSGGTGKAIPKALVRKASERGALWLAGGITPLNARQYADEFRPELMDASSGLESSPGKKDPILMKTFFRELRNER
ncbi:MAG TPA: bifunctional indole-3-glycerol phosphate synthase/phosphoribosylanthranilate isomerase [Treponemataceae bacterium]|mgnify:CR=1 FL=1|nr:bifunctional indole-3-glycerol phosphate synthase/phosphoribosylanthranilate isomerase [Treponemataceae bacterium]